MMALIAALAVMFSWAFSPNTFLIQVRSTYAPMQFNTALLFACLSLAFFAELRYHGLRDAFCLFVFLFAFATLSQYLTGIDFGIDQFFTKSSIMVLTSHPGRMAPQTAFVFILLSTGILLRKFDHKFALLSNVISLLALAVTLLGAASYFSTASAFAWGNFSKMAILTSILFTFLSLTQLVVNYLKYSERWRWSPYLASALVLFLGLTLWVTYFNKIAEDLKTEVHATLLHESALIKGLIEDRMNAINRMTERLSYTGPNQNWALDLNNYFRSYNDLKTIFVGLSTIKKNQKSLTGFKKMDIVWDFERKNPYNDFSVKLPLYYYSQFGLRNVGFEIDLASVAKRVVLLDDYFTSLRVGDTIFHFSDEFSKSVDAEWGQEVEFQLYATKVTLRKTPKLKKMTSNQASLSLFLITVIFCTAVWTAYSIQLNSDLRESKEILAHASSRLKALIAALPFGVFQTDSSGKCIFVSEKWCEITGFSPLEAYGEGWVDALHPDDRESVFKEWAKATQLKKEFELKYRFLKKNGNIVWVQGKAMTLRNSSGDPIGSIGGVLDISNEVEQLKIVETQKIQLIQSDRMRSLGQMAGGIAHEINTPLAVIEMNVNLIREMAKNNCLENKVAVSASNKISSIVDRISTIIRGLRSFARDGNQDAFVSNSIHELISDTLSLCKDRFDRAKVILKFENNDFNLRINCRSAQVSQVLVNLLNNSLDAIAMQESPWIKIELAEDTNWVYIHVIDSGSGIQKSLQDKIMEPFFTTKEIGKGTGLGLSISLGIMHSHGGSLDYDPSYANTKFTMKFPKPQIDT